MTHTKLGTRSRTRVAAQGVALLLAGSGLALATTGAAAAASCPGAPGDVNGDGYAEVVVGEEGNHSSAGAVHVFYGGPNGLVTGAAGKARDDQYLTQSTKGIPGTEKSGVRFGSAAAFGDFNRDGCADLAIGARGEETVTIVYGSTTGLRTSEARRYAVSELVGAAGPKPRGVGGITVGDLNRDGTDDLAIGAYLTETGSNTGGVVVLFGDRAGLNRGATKAELVTLDTPGVPDPPDHRGGADFGNPLVTGDFDGDGRAELAVHTEGGVQVLKRGTNGFDRPQPAPLTSSTPGFPGDASDWRDFGYVLAVGDVTGDGRDDLAVGHPAYRCIDCNDDENLGEGAVALFDGSATGLTTASAQLWTQDSPGVEGAAGEEHAFGSALAIGLLDDGPNEDLVIGAVKDAVGSVELAGSATVLLGGSSGLTTAGVGGTRFHQDVAGVPGAAEMGDGFGATVAVSALQSQRRGSLVIGVPGEDLGTAESAGMIHQLGTTPGGPTAAGGKALSAASPGVKGTARAGEMFGSTLG